jgi:hypothetical protein
MKNLTPDSTLSKLIEEVKKFYQGIVKALSPGYRRNIFVIRSLSMGYFFNMARFLFVDFFVALARLSYRRKPR